MNIVALQNIGEAGMYVRCWTGMAGLAKMPERAPIVPVTLCGDQM
jgi:hypothetical protein